MQFQWHFMPSEFMTWFNFLRMSLYHNPSSSVSCSVQSFNTQEAHPTKGEAKISQETQHFSVNLSERSEVQQEGNRMIPLVASYWGLFNAHSNLSLKSWSKYKNLLQAVSLRKSWKWDFFPVSLCVMERPCCTL